ncbi:MAG: DUF721 domain-containing protein [Chlamydiia bacterium]|nr:DUF721 domain-containing protein [Chlamydiia bacterium]
MRRTPKNYDGNQVTSKKVGDLLAGVLGTVSEKYQDKPDLILATWPSIVGEKLAPMAKAVRFDEGILYVKVKNSTLYSLLEQSEKRRLMATLKKKFPKVEIRGIQFRMG